MIVAQQAGKGDEAMKLIERQHLRIGQVITYSYPNTGHVCYGTIVHLGLGLAARNAVWVRPLDGRDTKNTECILLEYVTGVIADANR